MAIASGFLGQLDWCFHCNSDFFAEFMRNLEDALFKIIASTGEENGSRACLFCGGFFPSQ